MPRGAVGVAVHHEAKARTPEGACNGLRGHVHDVLLLMPVGGHAALPRILRYAQAPLQA